MKTLEKYRAILPYTLVLGWLTSLIFRLVFLNAPYPFYQLEYVTVVGLPDALVFIFSVTMLTVLAAHWSKRLSILRTLVITALTLYLALLLTAHPEAPFRFGVLLIALAAFAWLWPFSRKDAAPALVFGLAVYALYPFFCNPALFTALYADVQPPSNLWLLPLLLLLAFAFCLILFFTVRRQTLVRPFISGQIDRRGAAKVALAAAVLALVIHVGALSALMIMRVQALYTPTYDFGIFVQMFHNMSTNLSPVTTLERSVELSHFAIHVSPIFYLWLPFYTLFPQPETLQVLQILTVASGVIPFYLLARKLEISVVLCRLLAVVYLFYPALIGSSMYDVHENAFLAPLILWLLWAAAGRRKILFFLFAILTLAVKEDAALYVIAIGLWLFFDRSRRLCAVVVIVLSLGWFFLAARLLESQGHGVMTYRFENLMAFPQYGLPGILLTALSNPGYLLSEMMSAVKVQYLLKMLLPVAFLPLLQKRLSRFALLIPLIVMNLVSRYQYQANIGFQYHYGSGVLLLVLALLWFADRSGKAHAFSTVGREDEALLPKQTENRGGEHRSSFAVSYAMMLSLLASVIFGTVLFLHYAWPFQYVTNNRQALTEMRNTLESIPQDTSVRASTFMTVPLANRSFLIDLGYGNLPGADQRQADYLVFDLRAKLTSDLSAQLKEARDGDYETFRELKNRLLILKRKGAR